MYIMSSLRENIIEILLGILKALHSVDNRTLKENIEEALHLK